MVWFQKSRDLQPEIKEKKKTAMSKFLERLSRGPILCDGAMGTLLYAKGVFINRCYDELNVSQPEIVGAVHAEYAKAGAEILETNTFGANRYRLVRHGFEARVAEINRQECGWRGRRRAGI
jgi:methionine synthase I (cobalamin-dependent)